MVDFPSVCREWYCSCKLVNHKVASARIALVSSSRPTQALIPLGSASASTGETTMKADKLYLLSISVCS